METPHLIYVCDLMVLRTTPHIHQIWKEHRDRLSECESQHSTELTGGQDPPVSVPDPPALGLQSGATTLSYGLLGAELGSSWLSQYFIHWAIPHPPVLCILFYQQTMLSNLPICNLFMCLNSFWKLICTSNTVLFPFFNNHLKLSLIYCMRERKNY